MDVGLAWRGAVFGVAIAAPVGPIAVLLIRRTLTRGRAVGFASGLGAATADLTYGLVVALGLTAVTDRLVSAERGLQAVGGLVLLALGIRTIRSAPAPAEAADTSRRSLAAAYASTYALTLTNPATIVLFLAVFASIGVVATSGSSGDALTIATGVAVGSAAWQLSLCTAVSLLRGRLTDSRVRWVNITSGLVIAGFGVAALAAAAS
ncbi:MAG TPA: LysE family translocator [Mycobacteriales bacterium]|nr:LysE family translocator [Mycobacteriales bacterium]